MDRLPSTLPALALCLISLAHTAIASPDRAASKRAFEAMMTMSKIDIARIEAALKG